MVELAVVAVELAVVGIRKSYYFVVIYSCFSSIPVLFGW